MSAELGAYKSPVEAAMQGLDQKEIINRIWAHDHPVWKPEPTEISNRRVIHFELEMMRQQAFVH